MSVDRAKSILLLHYTWFMLYKPVLKAPNFYGGLSRMKTERHNVDFVKSSILCYIMRCAFGKPDAEVDGFVDG